MATLVSSGGSPPSGADQGEGGHTGATLGAGLEDQAYKGLGDTFPPHSRAHGTTPSTRHALCVLNGCCNQFHFILSVVDGYDWCGVRRQSPARCTIKTEASLVKGEMQYYRIVACRRWVGVISGDMVRVSMLGQ